MYVATVLGCAGGSDVQGEERQSKTGSPKAALCFYSQVDNMQRVEAKQCTDSTIWGAWIPVVPGQA